MKSRGFFFCLFVCVSTLLVNELEMAHRKNKNELFYIAETWRITPKSAILKTESCFFKWM